MTSTVPVGPERLSSVATASRILREFGKDSTQLGVSQLARSVGVGKSTSHRIIWTLVEEGLLEKVEDTGLFRLSPVMRNLGASTESALRLNEAATLPLDNLRLHSAGTLQVAILDGTDVLYVERRDGRALRGRRRRSVAARESAYLTSSGKVLLAYLPRDEQLRIIAGMRLVARTPRTITSRRLLMDELVIVRRQGYAESRGESDLDMCSVAAPIRGPLGRVVASVSVAEPVDDATAGLPHLVRIVTETAARISAGLA